MSKSNYTYKLEYFAGVECLLIEDQHVYGTRLKTVTNNIENVIKEIEEAEHTDVSMHVIVIKDTAGKWDGYSAANDQFELLQASNPYHAINRWLKRVMEAGANGNQ